MKEKHILVVGGSSGIGRSTVELLAGAGAHVYSLSRSPGNWENHTNVTYIPGDVTQDNLDLSGLPAALDGVVYCPGSINLKQLRSLSVEDFKTDFEVNLLGAVRVLKGAFNALRKGSHPSVVLFSTVAVEQGMPFHASVAASKAAVEGLVRSLAAEWAPTIRVNAIAPSLTDTPLAKNLLSTPEKAEASAKRHPLKRVGTAEDISHAVLFLLSDQSTWISGQVWHIDGGLSTLRV